MNISKHLTLAEVTNSPRANKLKLSNQPTAQHLDNLKLIAERIFEPIREHFGCPIYVSSGYRSAALNKATPGASSTSQHCSGEALDLDQNGKENGITNKDVFDFIRQNLEFDQLIWEHGNSDEPAWVHVSYESAGKQRRQVLKAEKNSKGKTIYSIWKG